jgi:hypothetical protein
MKIKDFIITVKFFSSLLEKNIYIYICVYFIVYKLKLNFELQTISCVSFRLTT